ncbi:MAG: DUF1634 domain-containing protein [Bacteroidota bacterium]
MVINAVLIVLLGILCLLGTIVAVIFTIISFSNNKPGKYIWLTGFLLCLFGMILCIFTFVRKAVHKVENFTSNLNEHLSSFNNYADTAAYSLENDLQSNKHIVLLKSYYPDSAAVPDQFYYYLGFETYYRLPLTYPYSIHCTLFKENGELFNESNVKHFDENDNGEIKTPIANIDRLAFDKKWLLIDQKIASTRSADYIHHYLLFSFETGESEEVNSEKDLFKLAKQKGYKGSNTLITLNDYDKLFREETVESKE